jgi:hypothetical protein
MWAGPIENGSEAAATMSGHAHLPLAAHALLIADGSVAPQRLRWTRQSVDVGPTRQDGPAA